MKYWQKLYLSVLILFIVCLGGGFAALAQYSIHTSYNERKDAFLSVQHIVAERLSSDMTAVRKRDPGAVLPLLRLYVERMRRQGYMFWAEDAEGNTYGYLPMTAELAVVQPGERGYQVIKNEANGHRCLVAVTALSDFRFGLGYDLDAFFRDWHRTLLRYLILVLSLVQLLAVGLFFVLQRLNRPIRELEAEVDRITEGAPKQQKIQAEDRQDELGELARALDQMETTVQQQMQELKEESQARQTLIDNLGHEMRTPLTAIKGFAQFLQRTEQDPEETFKSTEIICKESDRLLKLSEALVQLSVLRHEAPKMETVHLKDLLQFAVDSTRTKAEERGVSVQLRAEEDTVLQGAPALLESLMINLIDNAVKASKPGDRVSVTAEGRCVRITDMGCGMDPETLQKIEQPFFRADKARSRQEGGAGIGLALCRAIVDAHGASMTFQSAPGTGTVVEIIFYDSATT